MFLYSGSSTRREILEVVWGCIWGRGHGYDNINDVRYGGGTEKWRW